MLLAGGASITLAAETSWAFVNLVLALLYLPCMLVTRLAPEPDVLPPPPRTLREAVWGPFVGFLGQHRSLEILGFVVLYKLSDNLTQALTGPFLVQTGFGDFDVGVARTTIGQAAARALEEAILREGADTIGAFIAEPVMGEGGVIVPPADYFPLVRQICDKYEVLFIADEVITGFGRTGEWFALKHWGVKPDTQQI